MGNQTVPLYNSQRVNSLVQPPSNSEYGEDENDDDNEDTVHERCFAISTVNTDYSRKGSPQRPKSHVHRCLTETDSTSSWQWQRQRQHLHQRMRLTVPLWQTAIAASQASQQLL